MPAVNTISDQLFDHFFILFETEDRLARLDLMPRAVYEYYQLLQEPGYNALTIHDEIEHIKRILQKLPPQQARLCDLYFVDDFTYEEIARFTNLSPTTVKNHIAWSMIILRNYMTRPKAPV